MRRDSKARTSTHNGLHLDFVLKQFHRTTNDKQSEPEPVRARWVKAMKRLEDLMQTSGRNANAGVVDLDANDRPATTKSKQNAAAWSGEFHGIPHEILERHSLIGQDRLRPLRV